MKSSLNDATVRPDLQPLAQGLPDAQDMNNYGREFETVFSHDVLQHIAVSGPAASDKRSIVDAFSQTHDPQSWMSVCIPHFNKETSTISNAEAEEALINQVVCQMDLAKSPKTRFRGLMKRNYAIDAVIGCVFAAFVALTIFLVWIAGLIPSSRPAPALCALALVAWLACIGFCVYRVVRTNLIGRAFDKLRPNRKGSDIELSTGEDDSRIERYMGDLVYLLNTNRYDNIVFEDLDTYRNMPLFERLRALGTLANTQRTGKRRPLRFFYLVGDGLFDDPHERTRFFDHIIPVIPSLDTGNSTVQLRDGLADAQIVLDEDFLHDLSGFVDDPGLLRDIVNESRHYKAELFRQGEPNPGDMERLVALLTYKALFPRDFELLQNGQGYVSALLKSRPVIIDEMRSRNERKIAELASEQAAAGQSGDESRASQIQAELDQLDRENLECSRMSLAGLLAKMANPDIVFELPPAHQGLDKAYLDNVLASPYFPFIRFAIGNGWIDGSYERFMSSLYSESLTASDRELIAAVAQGSPTDASQTVSNPFSVVSHLDADQFALPSARVYALLSHLIAYGPTGKLQSLLAGIEHDDELPWLLAYTESDQFNGSVFGYMEQFLDQPIARLLEDEGIERSRKRNFCHRLLAFGRDTLGSEGVRHAVLEFAEADELFLRVECTAPLSIAEGIDEIGYRPAKIETAGCARDLLQFVYDHDLYQPTATAVDNIVASLLETDRAMPDGFLVTRLYSLRGAAVRENVEAAPDQFVSTLLSDSSVALNDTTDAIAWILNCDGLAPKRAIGYLKALSDGVSIDRIGPIANYTYQGILLDRGLVECTTANILDYFVSAGNIVDEHLAGFLQSHPFPENFTMATTEERLGSESGFLKAVIECAHLSDEKVGEISVAYRAQYNHFDIGGISEARTGMLVRNGVIRTTADNLRFVRQNCPAAAKFFAEADPFTYVQLVLSVDGGEAPCGFVRNEALDIFELPNVDDDSKVALLTGFSEPLSMSAKYGNELNAAIASRNFNVNDLGVIDDFYAKGNRKLKRALAEAVVTHREELAESGILLSMDMVTDIAWRLREDRAGMVGFIASQLAGREPEPTRLEVRTVFERANLKEYMALIDGPSAVIPDRPDDDALLEVLASMGMAGKQTGKTDWQGMRRITSKGYSRK